MNKTNIKLPLRVEHQLLILLLGALNRPIPSKHHIHKELFILTQAFPKLNKVLEFNAYLKGPFSRTIQDTLDDLLQRGYITKIGSSYTLSQQGRETFQQIANTLKQKILLNTIRKTREIYDQLDTDELLLLTYITYPNYTIESEELKRILKKAPTIIEKLQRKGIITERRKQEIYTKLKQLQQIHPAPQPQ